MTIAGDIHHIDLDNGCLLLIDKPLRWTSFDVVNKIKYAIKQEYGVKKFKIGHAGTLDPLATGMLIICVGKYTKEIPALQDARKTYEGTITLGATTLSCDLEHEPENFMPYKHLTITQIEQARNTFMGDIMQIPPSFSAVRIHGQRAFSLARQGQDDIPIQAKPIHIYRFDLPLIQLPQVNFIIECSKGTYIRSIARDMGNLLGCGAYLSTLQRTACGGFTLDNTFNFNELLPVNAPAKELRRKRNFDL